MSTSSNYIYLSTATYYQSVLVPYTLQGKWVTLATLAPNMGSFGFSFFRPCCCITPSIHRALSGCCCWDEVRVIRRWSVCGCLCLPRWRNRHTGPRFIIPLALQSSICGFRYARTIYNIPVGGVPPSPTNFTTPSGAINKPSPTKVKNHWVNWTEHGKRGWVVVLVCGLKSVQNLQIPSLFAPFNSSVCTVHFLPFFVPSSFLNPQSFHLSLRDWKQKDQKRPLGIFSSWVSR